MKKLIIFLICLICIIGCQNKESNTVYKTITSDEAYDIMQTRSDVFIIDVRSEEEYSTSHIENAINIPLDEIDKRFMSEVTDNFENTILVYCQSGRRSEEASKILSSMGFKNVNNFGGLNNWGYGLVSD